MSTQTATKQKSNAVIEGLQTVLSDSYALMAQTHLAHWNVEGPNFFQLHTAFQAQYEELFGAIDEIAERVRARWTPSRLADYRIWLKVRGSRNWRSNYPCQGFCCPSH